jgi:Bacterial alpha-L-rhamnosidase 6 hairpin glycosidase domain
MSEALLRSGHADAVGEFVRWYAAHQFSTGKVPCCVDARGSDPVPENDSQGELIFVIAQWWRYGHDRTGLDSLWPHVERTVAYMDQLRDSERKAANQVGDRRALYGLMPASISHEGYSAKPMHSYWDDFWSLIGYDDAAELATALGKPEEASRYAATRDQFRTDLKASILASMQQHHIDYIPGAAELGDFDATSTTIALSPGDAMDWLPSSLLAQTFQRYWQGFVARRNGSQHWDDYTPYELRTVASFVRLGWRDRVQQLLTFFLADRRPAAWNQWAEVVGRDPRKPRFVGDMPHAWIASDFLRSVYDMFAYERVGDRSLVLAAGLDPAWFAGRGVGIERLRTPWGALSYGLREEGRQLVLRIPVGQAMPPGGLVLPWPYPGAPVGATSMNGKSVNWHDGEIVIRSLPAVLSVSRPGAGSAP